MSICAIGIETVSYTHLIVTSIQKMSKVNNKEFPTKKTEIEKIVYKRVVFIIYVLKKMSTTDVYKRQA